MFPKAFMRAEVAKILDFVLQVDDATLKRESPDAIRQCLEKVSSGIGADYPNLYVCVTHGGHPRCSPAWRPQLAVLVQGGCTVLPFFIAATPPVWP